MGTALHETARSMPLMQGPRRQRRHQCTPVRQVLMSLEMEGAKCRHLKACTSLFVTSHACMSTRAAKRAKGPKTAAPPSGGGKKSSGGQPVSYKSPGKVSEGCVPALACTRGLQQCSYPC